jgi:thymidylate synthase
MLAYPTPTFDAKTILEGPGHRPLGRGASYVFPTTASPMSPAGCVNKKAYNSRGFTGSRAEKFIQDNQFLQEKRAPGVNPLSVPGYVGNEFEGGYAPRPTFAEPKNGQMLQMLDVLNNRSDARHGADLSPAQIKFITEQTMKAATPQVGGEQVATDLANSQRAMTKEVRIRNAMAQGFTRQEAESAYNKLRDEEAKTALFAQQSLSTRLYDLVDSKLGGSQDGSVPGNDESALFLASRHPDIFPRAKVQPKYVNLSPQMMEIGLNKKGERTTNPSVAYAQNMARLRYADELGLPFNIASSSLLLIIIAKLTNLTPRYFNLSLGDAHIYLNHVDPLVKQIQKIPYTFPQIELPEFKTLEDVEKLTFKDFKIINYRSYETVKMEMIA